MDHADDPSEEPETRRIAQLADALREGRASEAQREELALYAQENPQAQALARRAGLEEALGGEWLARTQADERLVAAENTPYTKAERSVGVALVAGGVVGAFFFPPAGVAIAAGAFLLGVSVLRVKLKTIGQDPYDKIER